LFLFFLKKKNSNQSKCNIKKKKRKEKKRKFFETDHFAFASDSDFFPLKEQERKRNLGQKIPSNWANFGRESQFLMKNLPVHFIRVLGVEGGQTFSKRKRMN